MFAVRPCVGTSAARKSHYMSFFSSLEVGAKVITPFFLVFLSLICLFLVIAFALIEVTLPSFSIEFFALFVFPEVVESASSPINEQREACVTVKWCIEVLCLCVCVGGGYMCLDMETSMLIDGKMVREANAQKLTSE